LVVQNAIAIGETPFADAVAMKTYYAKKSDWAAAKAAEYRAKANREGKAHYRVYRSKQAVVDSYLASERQWMQRAERYRKDEASDLRMAAA
jgi:hypothetical protein